jgi:hypothetical protein
MTYDEDDEPRSFTVPPAFSNRFSVPDKVVVKGEEHLPEGKVSYVTWCVGAGGPQWIYQVDFRSPDHPRATDGSRNGFYLQSELEEYKPGV